MESGIHLGCARASADGEGEVYGGSGYSMGFELQMTPVKWLPLSVDMRLHESLNSYGDPADEKIEFLALGLGWRLAW
ncbi:hypothetical protein [Myxococcus stipitatus]|uniref:hypothetical protein n=1 Tax=Myxococcus stipitatus TaxID=83455 RepID=UPI0030D27990